MVRVRGARTRGVSRNGISVALHRVAVMCTSCDYPVNGVRTDSERLSASEAKGIKQLAWDRTVRGRKTWRGERKNTAYMENGGGEVLRN
jgi:hypothetical protein